MGHTHNYGSCSQHSELQPMRALMAAFLKNERGATAIEYTIIAAGIALVIIATINGIGSTLNTTFSSVVFLSLLVLTLSVLITMWPERNWPDQLGSSILDLEEN
jgi:pilus assembly protein Flp/PilA